MIKVAIDSSVIIAILNGEPQFESWSELLVQLTNAGNQIVACGIVWAEISSEYSREADLCQDMKHQGIEFDALEPSTCYVAGRLFGQYRKSCRGPRKRILADFLVGAHAIHQACGLITNDGDYLKEYFQGLHFYKPQP